MNVQGGLVGYSMVHGHLRSMGINVQIERIRASISQVDPINCLLTWATVVSTVPLKSKLPPLASRLSRRESRLLRRD